MLKFLMGVYMEAYRNISVGFLIRLILMLVIYNLQNMEPKLKVAILFLLDAVDCGYTQFINHKQFGEFDLQYCNNPYYIVGDEILDVISYIMAYRLVGFNQYLFILVGLRALATIIYLITGNKRWFLAAPDAMKELVLYSWVYQLNPINVSVIIFIKLAVEYYYM